jgi:hypothetical protein
MDMNSIIRPGDDVLGEDPPTFTLTLTLAQAFAVKDAVCCLWTATQTDASADECYGEYAACGDMEAAHAVADTLAVMMRPHAARVGAVIQAHADAHTRRN